MQMFKPRYSLPLLLVVTLILCTVLRTAAGNPAPSTITCPHVQGCQTTDCRASGGNPQVDMPCGCYVQMLHDAWECTLGTPAKTFCAATGGAYVCSRFNKCIWQYNVYWGHQCVKTAYYCLPGGDENPDNFWGGNPVNCW